MRKIFGRADKPKDPPLQVPTQQTPITTPIHQQFASSGRPRESTEDERWEFLDSQQTPPPLPPAAPSPTRSPSPYINPPPPQTLRKKAPPPAVNLLNALEPATQQPSTHSRNRSEERPSENGHGQKEKKSGGFWGGGRDKEREREREREQREREKERERERALELDREHQRGRDRERRDEENELTRKIGFLTATASEDWTLVLDVCEHASANENNAREAVRALRREFKYGEPAAQLAAARLWAIMLRNSTDTFITQCTTRKFLDTLEDILVSSRTAPVVRERLMDVLAAAAYASGAKKESGFRGLWRRVKPRDKPEEGVPFDTDDAMFNPPLNALRHPGPGYEFENTNPPVVVYPDGTQTGPETPPIAAKQPRKRKNSDVTPGKKSSDKSHRDHHRGIIPPDEDMRRLFQECKIGVGNANLLSEALATATPEELRNPVISEFYKKCVDSQELIFTQIPWASAGAERSRASKDQVPRERGERKRKTSATPNGSLPDITTPVSTREEELLAELLAANEHLLEAIDLYKDLERVALERDAEERSRREVRMDPRQRARITEDGTLQDDSAGGGSGAGSASRSRSASPTRNPVVQHPLPHHPPVVGAPGELTFQTPPAITAAAQMLAPPPSAPHGPRLQGSGVSRTPSPSHPDLGHVSEHPGTRLGGPRDHSRGSLDDEPRVDPEDDDYDERPMQPSAKALGKRKVADPVDRIDSRDDELAGLKDDFDDRPLDSDDDDETPHGLWQHLHHPVQHFVYDAAAERTQQRLLAANANVMVNGVH